MMYCVEMSIRVLFDDKTEGDDFIAYYVAHKKPEERVIIVSTDQDLTQLISPTVAVYNRTLTKYLNVKNFQKIKGYHCQYGPGFNTINLSNGCCL